VRKTSIVGLSVLALSLSGWMAAAHAQEAPAAPDATPPAATDTPAPKAAMKPMKHKMKHMAMHEKTARDPKTGKLTGTKQGDAMVEDLNDKSLAAAKAGTPFTPGK
jgi:hypothetical protein